VDDFGRFTQGGRQAVPGGPAAQPPAAQPERPVAPQSIAPATFERRFTTLYSEGRLYEMWDMLAADAQRAWGSREQFISRMPRFDADAALLQVEMIELAMLDSWIDLAHGRIYSNVARMTMRYRISLSGSESTSEHLVHLIPAAAGWRTLCYPSSQV